MTYSDIKIWVAENFGVDVSLKEVKNEFPELHVIERNSSNVLEKFQAIYRERGGELIYKQLTK